MLQFGLVQYSVGEHLQLPGVELVERLWIRKAQQGIYLAAFELPDGMFFTVEYDTALFDASTVTWLMEAFQTLLATAVADHDRRLQSLIR